MPRIIINETENEVMKLLNPTENVVLIPLVCKYSTDEADKKAKYYLAEEISNFKADFYSKVMPISSVDGEVTTELHKENSYYYALALLEYGLNVVIKPVLASSASAVYVSEKEVADYLNAQITAGCLEEFKDKNIFNLKFITTGAHENVIRTATPGVLDGCYATLAAVASARGDCIALMELESDVVCEPNNDSENDLKTFLTGDQLQTEEYKYAACVFPWGSYKVCDFSALVLPGSFGYLSAYANSVQTNANWYAAAGVTRGAIPNLNSLNCEIGESQMHVLLNENETGSKIKFNVNPIMSISEYGDKIWGNKVVWVDSTTESYQSYLNVRILLCDIKKQIYYASTRVTFEPNDMITWLNFQQLANTLLDDMKANRGIEWYSWRRQATSKKATLKAILTIKPIEAVEYFDITVSLSSEQTDVTEI